MDITEDYVAHMLSKAGVPTENVTLQVTLEMKKFLDIPNTLTCRGKRIFITVEDRRPQCWVCDATGHLEKTIPTRNPTPQPSTSKEAMREASPVKSPMVTENGVKKGSKVATPPSTPQ